MRRHEDSASTPRAASILLPSAEVIRLPKAKRKRAEDGIFTKTTVAKMRCPPGKAEIFFWDASCRGLGLRALSSGRRSWIYQYRDAHGQTRRMALGDVSAVSIDAARSSARKEAAKVAQGGNPSPDRKKKRTAGTVLEAVEAYLRYAKERQRTRSYKETERHLRTHAKSLHHDRTEAVRRGDIAGLLERVAGASGPVAANRLRAALSALWTWGLRTGLIETDNNPVSFTVRQLEKSRDRTLDDIELKAIWAATGDGKDYSRIVRLCLLTGCRREEIGGLRWDEIQNDRIVFGVDRMKGKIAHEIALLPTILLTLPKRPEKEARNVFGRRGNGFSGWSRSKAGLDTKLTSLSVWIPAWGLHDLRRTFSTRLHDAGVDPIVVEALLAHKQQGVAAIYNRASFREAKKAALVHWLQLLENVIKP